MSDEHANLLPDHELASEIGAEPPQDPFLAPVQPLLIGAAATGELGDGFAGHEAAVKDAVVLVAEALERAADRGADMGRVPGQIPCLKGALLQGFDRGFGPELQRQLAAAAPACDARGK